MRRGRSRSTAEPRGDKRRSESRNGASDRPKAPNGHDRPRRERVAPAEPAPAPVALFPRNGDRAPQKPRPPASPERPEQRVVGFGDDLPAFLARPPKVAARA